MLVKQVFSRFMGVWIFAVALLVGEVFCIKPEEVFQAGRAANSINKRLLDARIEFMDMKQLSPTMISVQRDISERLELISADVDKFVSSISADLKLDLSHLYEPGKSKSDVEARRKIRLTVPPPFAPNLLEIVRVRALETSLGVFKTALDGIKRRVDASFWRSTLKNSVKLRRQISDVIHLFDKLPFSYDDVPTRVHLSKKTTEVPLEDMVDAYTQMKIDLLDYISDTSDGQWDPNAVVVHFLRLTKKKGRACTIDPAILRVLDELYWKSRFYRLAASEDHTISVQGYPSVLPITNLLQKSIQKLERFANALRPAQFTDTLKKDYWNKDAGAILGILDPTNESLHASAVYDLRAALGSALPLSPLALSKAEEENQDFITQFAEVFYEVEDMSYFIGEYELMIVLAEEKKSMNKRDKLGINFKFLVAYMDQKLEQLLRTLTSDTLTVRLCPSHPGRYEEARASAATFKLEDKLTHLCALKNRALRALTDADRKAGVTNDSDADPFDHTESFYSEFRNRLNIGPGEALRLQKKELNNPRKLFVAWTIKVAWLKAGLRELYAKP